MRGSAAGSGSAGHAIRHRSLSLVALQAVQEFAPGKFFEGFRRCNCLKAAQANGVVSSVRVLTVGKLRKEEYFFGCHLGSECHYAAAIAFRGQASTSATENNTHKSVMAAECAEVFDRRCTTYAPARRTRFSRERVENGNDLVRWAKAATTAVSSNHDFSEFELRRREGWAAFESRCDVWPLFRERMPSVAGWLGHLLKRVLQVGLGIC